MRGKMLAMSQEALGKALRLTFQQVQKYETGANRIGGRRLQQISQILQVPIEFSSRMSRARRRYPDRMKACYRWPTWMTSSQARMAFG
jgi:transcriptional regulator with XRE-family HTH domain